ncbi:hypothetical protein [Gillisia marina]|uniref:hypothetical protein n=1 Tax=Gillisia marina TaxID=1167637 RepID=UPI00029A6C88|nr:hypothetical protein [Gillisia marina]
MLHGNHRVSALKALRYKEVYAVIRPGHPSVIDWDNLDDWTKERGGIYTKELVIELFNMLFHGSGLQKARRYNLINKAPVL